MQARYPQVADMFRGHEDLVEAVRGFWGEGPEETCFAEMQVLAQHAGAFSETDPDALWPAIESAVATVPLDLGLPPRRPRNGRYTWSGSACSRSLPSSSTSYLDLLREVWAPVNDMWQQALPLLRGGRPPRRGPVRA